MDTSTEKPNASNNLPMIITVVGLIALIGLFIYKSGMPSESAPDSSQVMNEPENKRDTEVTAKESSDSDAQEPSGEVKEFMVKANNFVYDIKEIKVKKGDRVRINFVNDEGFHDWVVDEFNAKTKQLNASGKESIEFVADKTGTFEYYCSVGKHRQMGMVGNLIVE